MDIQKINTWIDNVLNEDGQRLHPGSIRTLSDIKTEINSILESRVMKSKDMYPGIAAMTLKNKHGWRDQKDLKVDGEFKITEININLVSPEGNRKKV